MSKRKSYQKMRENIFRRIPDLVRPLVNVALENYPHLVNDINNIIITHSCREKRAPELAEHLVALVAAEQIQNNPTRRANLRMEAFKGAPVDSDISGGRKQFAITTAEMVRVGEGGCEIKMRDGLSFWASTPVDGYVPQIGSTIWQYTIGISFILGTVIDGHVFCYKTLALSDADHKAELERQRAAEREKFPEHDERIAKLPEIFQQRIHKFQRAPYFREDLEVYEIFVCEQAVLFAERWKTVDKLIRWYNLNYTHQVKLMPSLEEANHSGNTFGAACCLARFYLESPDMVLRMYGALAPLVGSDAYLPTEERHGAA